MKGIGSSLKSEAESGYLESFWGFQVEEIVTTQEEAKKENVKISPKGLKAKILSSLSKN
jgi:hypothetical protein